MNPETLKHYPAEYTHGSVEFFGRKFAITPDVLIPRLETEGLVRRARQVLSGTMNHEPGTMVVDIGTGSGIIGTSVADLADEVILLDISPEALEVAQRNFRTHFPQKKAEFIVSDVVENGQILRIAQHDKSYLLLANLPYIKDEDWQNMSEDTRHEPKIALFGGKKTGFELYERLFEQLQTIKLSNYQTIKLIIEFGFDQREIAEQILQKYLHWKYEFFADYAGIERFCEISIQ